MTDPTLDNLEKAIAEAGFSIMSDEEFSDWKKAADAYHASPEAKASADLQESYLDYYLNHLAQYKFTPEMGEISGFGGGYEKTCQCMLDMGLRWFDANQEADPRFQGGENIYGVIKENNEDAEQLSKAVVAGSFGDCTGAMHQAVISSILWIRKNGWNKYVEAMTKEENK
jgi:hypothetical protein